MAQAPAARPDSPFERSDKIVGIMGGENFASDLDWAKRVGVRSTVKRPAHQGLIAWKVTPRCGCQCRCYVTEACSFGIMNQLMRR